jgi:predicted nucleic acid-binding protein
LSLLLDTSVAIALRDGDADAARRAYTIDGQILLSSITVVELFGGILREPVEAERRQAMLDAMLLGARILPFDIREAMIYRRIVLARGFSRRKIIDRMIAATALATDLTLVTLNASDFADVPGLKLENWG